MRNCAICFAEHTSGVDQSRRDDMEALGYMFIVSQTAARCLSLTATSNSFAAASRGRV